MFLMSFISFSSLGTEYTVDHISGPPTQDRPVFFVALPSGGTQTNQNFHLPPSLPDIFITWTSRALGNANVTPVDRHSTRTNHTTCPIWPYHTSTQQDGDLNETKSFEDDDINVGKGLQTLITITKTTKGSSKHTRRLVNIPHGPKPN